MSRLLLKSSPVTLAYDFGVSQRAWNLPSKTEGEVAELRIEAEEQTASPSLRLILTAKGREP